jgi:hypothetical protein
MVELVHTGRSPEGLAQVEPTAQSIRNWVGRAECDTGRRSDYLRQRERLLDYAASHIQHMQKALMQMNLQLHHVVSDITGATGMRIIRAFVAGERNPVTLAALRKIIRLMIGKQSGKVGYAVMSFGGFMGIGEDYYPLPWPLLTYNPRLEGYEVNITDAQLKGAPKYSTHENWDWGSRARTIDDYYKAQPNWMM